MDPDQQNRRGNESKDNEAGALAAGSGAATTGGGIVREFAKMFGSNKSFDGNAAPLLGNQHARRPFSPSGSSGGDRSSKQILPMHMAMGTTNMSIHGGTTAPNESHMFVHPHSSSVSCSQQPSSIAAAAGLISRGADGESTRRGGVGTISRNRSGSIPTVNASTVAYSTMNQHLRIGGVGPAFQLPSRPTSSVAPRRSSLSIGSMGDPDQPAPLQAGGGGFLRTGRRRSSSSGAVSDFAVLAPNRGLSASHSDRSGFTDGSSGGGNGMVQLQVQVSKARGAEGRAEWVVGRLATILTLLITTTAISSKSYSIINYFSDTARTMIIIR